MGIFSAKLFEFMNCKTVTLLLMLLFFMLMVSAEEVDGTRPAQEYSAEAVLQLTPDEQKWLAAHKTIRIAYDGSLPPYSFINDTGKIDGIAYEIMEILSRRLGVDFAIYPDSNWTSIYKAAAKRKVDIVATMVKRPDRAEWFSFTKPYLTKSLVIVTQSGNTTIHSRDDLKDKKIAVVKGYQYGEQVGNEFPSAKRTNVDTMLDSLKQVASGQADAAILFLGTANYLQTKYQLDNLKVAAFYDRNSANESIAVRKDWPILLDILQKTLDSLTEEEIQEIFAKWIVGDPQSTSAASPKSDAGQIPQVVAETLPPPPPVEQANDDSSQTKPVVKEIEQKPAGYSIEKSTPQPGPVTVNKDVNHLILLGLLVVAFFIWWVFLMRKQRTLHSNARNEMMMSIRTLQSRHNDVKNFTVEYPAPAAEEDLVPGLREFTAKPQNDFIYYQHDCDGRFSYVSESVTRLLGYSEAEFMANYRNYLTDNPKNSQIDAYTENCIKGQPNPPYGIEIYDSKGIRRWLEVTDTPVYDGQGHCIGVDGVMHEVSEWKTDHVVAKAKDVAPVNEESLPDIEISGERDSFLMAVQQAIQGANRNHKSFAVIYLALERLRMLDGSPAMFSEMDVLDEAGKRLFSTLRSTDVVIKLDTAKYALILPDTEIGAVSLIIDKIRKILQIPYLVGISSVVLDANVGSAVYPGVHNEPESLIEEAKTLLYTSDVETDKTAPPINADYLQDESMQMQQDLVQALDECKLTLRSKNTLNINALSRNSQFSVYYQSRHYAEDFEIAGFEALIRWHHPKLGLLLPKDFVGLVKEIGMLDVLTYWIIQQVSFQALAWEKSGIRPKAMAVNVEGLALKQAVDVNRIVEVIKETGAMPEWLEFSIPESEIAKNPDLLVPIIKQFVDAGLSVAIDNFGSESVLLEQLKAMPAQIIEIDPEFIRGLPGNRDDADIISYTIGMLHELGKTVLVKEVENEQQLDYLKKCGCDVVQGHLLSRPLPAKEAKELMETLPEFVWFLQQ